MGAEVAAERRIRDGDRRVHSRKSHSSARCASIADARLAMMRVADFERSRLLRRMGNLSRTANLEPQTSNREPRTANREPRTANREPRTANREPQTANCKLQAETGKREA
ncbi:hypothetical protein [Burkholderia sp. ABCPW 111]|uniref:hypothetical protein n=1 Tax=Burkholderia sp. ABCPW 111 TaxID=1820025 RepID=UPI0005726607|nr:hypothetical protein [Burkholderia sp. ABCPW 111]